MFKQQLLFLVLHLSSLINCQSNYADQANNVEYQGKGLPEQATLDGKVTKLDDLSPVIFLNRTKAALNCAAGSMQVELKFNQPFNGLAYANFDRNSACQVYGKGLHSYKLELPLKGCGTKQGPQRVFTNNIVVRFSSSLEIDGDEIITVVCRYPPPVAPIPVAPPKFIRNEVTPSPSLEPPLKGFQILLIICGILFLSLLLLGLGCSYYCLRRNNMTIIRKQPLSTMGSVSEITKLSGSSLGNLSMFEGLKIPRVHAPPVIIGSSSSSEGPLISDTLPSDYPSESHSEIDEADNRSLPVSSAGSFENKAYLQESYYTESYLHTQEEHIQNDQAKKIKKAISPQFSSDESSIIRTERNLSTIVEQREESVRSMESPVEKTQFTYVPELHPPPKHIQPAPTFTKILRRQQELQEMNDSRSMTEIIVENKSKYVNTTPPPIIPKQEYSYDLEKIETLEPPIAAVHKPEITSHVVDDVFLRTITEKKTIEDIERHKRLITEYHTRAKPLTDQHWDVTIRNYPKDMPEPPEWENFSDISSASGLTLTPKPQKPPINYPQNTIDDNKLPLNSPELVGNIDQQSYRAEENIFMSYNIPIENPQVPNWNVLIRVFLPTEQEESPVIENAETFNSQLTVADKLKWRQIITTESTLRTLFTKANTREELERIRHDSRYEKIFEPHKWDIIIRILSPIDKQRKSKKKNEWDTRSRRSSLPTLYEYDSDGGSSARTTTQEQTVHPFIPSRLRKNSRSSYKSEADLRSMSEVTVYFGQPDAADSHSESSSYYRGTNKYYDDTETFTQNPSLARSLSQPSLARSASEFTERWIAPSRYDTASEFTSPEVTPKSQRSTRIQSLMSGSRVTTEGRRSMWQAPHGLLNDSEIHHQDLSQQFQNTSKTTYTESRKNWFADNESETSFK